MASGEASDVLQGLVLGWLFAIYLNQFPGWMVRGLTKLPHQITELSSHAFPTEKI